jgi:hypothetical protein
MRYPADSGPRLLDLPRMRVRLLLLRGMIRIANFFRMR